MAGEAHDDDSGEAVDTRAPSPVSIVVITWNRRHEVIGNVRRLVALAESPPVIVVDNGSADGTVDALRASFPRDRVTVVPLERNIGAAARNVGVAAATTPYVAFADDDSWWAPGSLTRAAALLDRRPDAAMVAARVLVGAERRVDPVSRAMEQPGVPVLGFLACGAVVRRSAFLAVGGFSDLLGIGGEERLLAIDLAAAGWSLVHASDVVALHDPSSSPRPERRRRMVRNRLWTCWMRRRLPAAVRVTVRTVVESATDAHARAGVVDAVLGAHRALRRRRAISPLLESWCRVVDAQATGT